MQQNLLVPKTSVLNVLKATLSYLTDRSLPATPLNYAKAYSAVTGDDTPFERALPPTAKQAIVSLLQYEALIDRAVSGDTQNSLTDAAALQSLSAAELICMADNSRENRVKRGAMVAETIGGIVAAVDSALASASSALKKTSSLHAQGKSSSESPHKVSNLKEALLVIEALQAQALAVNQGFEEVVEALQKNEMLLRSMQGKLKAVESERDSAVDKALHDPLTGLLNRRGLEGRMAESTAGALLLTDLDNFKQVNDTYGHPVGDEVLRRFAATIKENLRATDLAGRTGGEEFVMFFPNTSLEVARTVGNRILQACSNLKIKGAEPLKISFSGGLALVEVDYPHSGNVLDAMAKADAYLYRAKKAGKARIVG